MKHPKLNLFLLIGEYPPRPTDTDATTEEVSDVRRGPSLIPDRSRTSTAGFHHSLTRRRWSS